MRRNTKSKSSKSKSSKKDAFACNETCEDIPKKALVCHNNGATFETLCIKKEATDSHLSKHGQDHCGECNDIDYCGEPPIGSLQCNRDTGTWTVEKGKVWNWTHPSKLTPSDEIYSDCWLGFSVAASGSQVFAGSPRDDFIVDVFATDSIWYQVDGETRENLTITSGSVSVFELNQLSGSWTEKEKLFASDRIGISGFGWSLAVFQDILVVGAFSENLTTNFFSFVRLAPFPKWSKSFKKTFQFKNSTGCFDGTRC
jgi:hypothetical protein